MGGWGWNKGGGSACPWFVQGDYLRAPEDGTYSLKVTVTFPAGTPAPIYMHAEIWNEASPWGFEEDDGYWDGTSPEFSGGQLIAATPLSVQTASLAMVTGDGGAFYAYSEGDPPASYRIVAPFRVEIGTCVATANLRANGSWQP